MYVVSIFSCLASFAKMDTERFWQSSSTMHFSTTRIANCNSSLLYVLEQNNFAIHTTCKSANISTGGGTTLSQNRTLWPVGGGAIALQPGWFQGHATAFFYINMGFGTDGFDGGPANMSNPMVPVFQITGPSKGPYPGTFCLPQVPLPANVTAEIGMNATIQVVEVAVHGASLYNVSFAGSLQGWVLC